MHHGARKFDSRNTPPEKRTTRRRSVRASMIKKNVSAFGLKHPAFRPFHAGRIACRVMRVPDESATS